MLHIFSKIWLNMQHLAERPSIEDGGRTTEQCIIAPYFAKWPTEKWIIQLEQFEKFLRTRCYSLCQENTLTGFQADHGFRNFCEVGPCFYFIKLKCCCKCNCTHSLSLAGYQPLFLHSSWFFSFMFTSAEWSDAGPEVWLPARRFAQKVIQIPGRAGKMWASNCKALTPSHCGCTHWLSWTTLRCRWIRVNV